MGLFDKIFGGDKQPENFDIDAEKNVLVIEYKDGGNLEKLVGKGPTRKDDCIRGVWRSIQDSKPIDPMLVTRIYSEWQPSQADTQFIKTTFQNAKLTFSFDRPLSEDGWTTAMKSAIQKMIAARK